MNVNKRRVGMIATTLVALATLASPALADSRQRTTAQGNIDRHLGWEQGQGNPHRG